LKRGAGRIPSGEDKLTPNAITIRCLQTIDGQLPDEPDQRTCTRSSAAVTEV
jgi:hypothetical protein